MGVWCFLLLAIAVLGADSSPNIVLIYVDDVGYGDFQSYGHPTQERGAVDDLAREGIRFTQWYSSAPVCTPSRAALLTGKLPVRTGIWGKRRPVFIHGDSGGLPKSEITIAEALRDRAGYETGMVGKWHLGINEFKEGDGNHLPHHHGFDYVGTLLPYTHDWPCDPRHFSVEQMKEVCFLYRNRTLVQQPYDPTLLATDMSADATAFIRRNHLRRREGGKPFFLYYSLPHAHSAMICSQQFCNSSKRGPYGDNINELSWMVGQVVDTLKELHIADNTLVLFLSDHGPQVGLCSHGGSAGVLKGMKLTTWEGGIRVPAIAWWPGTIPAGVVNHQVLSTLDVFDTLLDIAGVAPTEDRDLAGRDGKSIREVLLGATEKPEQVHDILYFYCNDVLSAVRLGRYKFRSPCGICGGTTHRGGPDVPHRAPPSGGELERSEQGMEEEEEENEVGKVGEEESRHQRFPILQMTQDASALAPVEAERAEEEEGSGEGGEEEEEERQVATRLWRRRG